MNSVTGIFQGFLPQIYLTTYRNTCFSKQLFSKNIFSGCLLHIHLYNPGFSFSSCIVNCGFDFLLKGYKASPREQKILQERKNHGKIMFRLEITRIVGEMKISLITVKIMSRGIVLKSQREDHELTVKALKFGLMRKCLH